MILSLVQFWILGCGVTLRFIGVPLEGEEVSFDELQSTVLALQPAPDAIVLLGGGMGVHPKCERAEIFGGADRVWTASRLCHILKSPFVTLSGGGAKGELAFLTDMGVETNRVLMIESARNTEEEARLILKAISEKRPRTQGGVPCIVLVTSAWHMPRAKMLFEHVGFTVIPAPTDYEMNGAAEDDLAFADFLPNHEALLRNSYAVKEWVARLGYRLKYSIGTHSQGE